MGQFKSLVERNFPYAIEKDQGKSASKLDLEWAGALEKIKACGNKKVKLRFYKDVTEESRLQKLEKILLRKGYRVVITEDHRLYYVNVIWGKNTLVDF